ncbi:NADP-dependent oxidoreductase [Arthrobacter sp. TB 26]|uniref:NADP-dependent oxidoreductase n=1 Tax=Arthrobacter sp. TB 26 TaxID=494420 RepID=UPI0004226833|nr:NADP-dependent oxidoreductase [Arthrobacter sp. TB 26]
MAHRANRQVILANRPAGIPRSEHFAIADSMIGDPEPGQVLVKNEYLSVDPAMRGWVSAESNYSSPVPVGSVMRGSAVGTVIESNKTRLQIGDQVVGRFGWQEYALVAETDHVLRVNTAFPASLALGVLGANGITAWLGLLDVARPLPGELVVVSTAAGAVGSVVGQLARLAGCRTIGITSSQRKVDICLDEYGFDSALNYRAPDFREELEEACGDGVDVYFDNTSGPISDSLMPHLAHGARVVVCGTAAIESWDPWPSGPRVHRHLLTKGASMHGFLLQDHAHEFEGVLERLAPLVRSGAIRYHEHVLDGLESAPGAVSLLYEGGNVGKTIIRL